MRAAALAVVAFVAFAPARSLAHAMFGTANGFYAGLVHPVIAIENVLALLAVGLLAGRQAGERGLWAALAMAAACTIGALAARSLPAVTWPGVAEAALVLIFGLAVAAAWAPPAPIVFALVASLGLIFGYLQAVDLDLAVSPLAFAGGLALGVGVLVLYCTALVARLRAPWANIGVRVVGSWIAAIDALILGLAFR